MFGILSYSGATTISPIYDYTALSTRTAVLEFSFKSIGNNKVGYLDNVSIVDMNVSNAQMLINGGFENGTLLG